MNSVFTQGDTDMVMTLPDRPTALFKYLKRCQPQAPNISDEGDVSIGGSFCHWQDPSLVSGRVAFAARDPFDQPPSLSQRKRRWLSLLFGCAQVAAVGLSLWMPERAKPQPTSVEPQPTTEQQVQEVQERLWYALASESLAETLRTAKEKQVDEQLAIAKQERLQAQQLRIEAEAKARNLTDSAANQARQTTVEAIRQADLIALDATLVGAEQVIYAEAGDDITLKFAARIQCKDGSFGETAVAAPVDTRIAPREVRNLAICYPSPETPTGKPIGQAGAWGVAFFKRGVTPPQRRQH